MKKPTFDPTWPENWKMSYSYDCEEMFGEIKNYGYVYAYTRRMAEILRIIQQAAKPPASVLDVAAAAGNLSLSLAELGYTVTWNDLRTDLVDYVRLKHEKGAIQYAPGNVFELGFENAFDVVLVAEIIEHVAHPDDFLRKIGRMVKPGGHVVMTTPNGGYFINPLPKFSDCADPSQFESVQFKPNSDGHIFLLHEDEIPVLAGKAGLHVETIRMATNFLTHGHVKTEMLLKVLPKWIVDGAEWTTQHLPGFLKRRLHTSMSVLLSKPA
jgi:2-polyprenyl-3-methyl-5-hydroxy-6-metoxy-1,4-benzoquinol methylase